MNDDQYSYLWDGSAPAWALLHINSSSREEEPRYVIVNTDTKRTLLIQDNATYARVKELMLEHGARIVLPGL